MLMFFACYWTLFCQMLLHKLLPCAVRSGHFSRIENSLITQEVPRPDFMIILKKGFITRCFRPRDLST